MSTVSSAKARSSLPELLDRVAAGEEITITRHGRPVAIVVRPDALRIRRAGSALARAEELSQALDAARASRPRTIRRGITPARAEELVADARASRRKR